jgi:plasmid replication initiation protein
MSEDLVPVNTPETLGVTPRYVLQHNAISRSAHNLSATAKKLTAMAMALLPADLSSLTAEFTFSQFCTALGLPIGGKTYSIFRAAVRECLQCVISIETDPDKKGKKEWKEFTWFTVSTFSEKTGKATMTFSGELADFLRAFKWVYTKISLPDLGCLHSRYAIRLFELVMSSAFLQGKQGNADKTWYFQASVPDYRIMLGVPEEAYQETHLFKQKVIEGPVKEINEAGIGVAITPEGVKQGRSLVAIRLTCTQTPRKAPTKRGRTKKAAVPQPELSTITLQTEDCRIEKELELLKERYASEFADLYAAELAKPSFMPPTSEIRKLAAAGAAAQTLKARYGIVK